MNYVLTQIIAGFYAEHGFDRVGKYASFIGMLFDASIAGGRGEGWNRGGKFVVVADRIETTSGTFLRIREFFCHSSEHSFIVFEDATCRPKPDGPGSGVCVSRRTNPTSTLVETEPQRPVLRIQACFISLYGFGVAELTDKMVSELKWVQGRRKVITSRAQVEGYSSTLRLRRDVKELGATLARR